MDLDGPVKIVGQIQTKMFLCVYSLNMFFPKEKEGVTCNFIAWKIISSDLYFHFWAQLFILENLRLKL